MNSSIRLADYDTYTRIIFLNDVYFDYRDILQLTMTRLDGSSTSEPPDYDLACALDFGKSGVLHLVSLRLLGRPTTCGRAAQAGQSSLTN